MLVQNKSQDIKCISKFAVFRQIDLQAVIGEKWLCVFKEKGGKYNDFKGFIQRITEQTDNFSIF